MGARKSETSFRKKTKALISLAYYISELLGKGTIDKKSSGETKGRQGSSSRNYDVLGRELLTPDEARKLDNKKCLIFIRGFDPIIDTKFIPYTHPAFSQTSDGKGEAYVHTTISRSGIVGPQFEILSPSAVMYYEKLKSNGDNVYIDSLKYEELQMIGKAGLERRFTNRMEASNPDQNANIQELSIEEQLVTGKDAIDYDRSNMETGKDKINSSNRKPPIRGADTITNRLIHLSYSEGQKDELKLALRAGVPKHDILNYFYPDTTIQEMQRMRLEFIKLSPEN